MSDDKNSSNENIKSVVVPIIVSVIGAAALIIGSLIQRDNTKTNTSPTAIVIASTPTNTPTNTLTPLPTNTPTNTPPPLPTNTPTNTPTPLPTNTLVPPTPLPTLHPEVQLKEYLDTWELRNEVFETESGESWGNNIYTSEPNVFTFGSDGTLNISANTKDRSAYSMLLSPTSVNNAAPYIISMDINQQKGCRIGFVFHYNGIENNYQNAYLYSIGSTNYNLRRFTTPNTQRLTVLDEGILPQGFQSENISNLSLLVEPQPEVGSAKYTFYADQQYLGEYIDTTPVYNPNVSIYTFVCPFLQASFQFDNFQIWTKPSDAILAAKYYDLSAKAYDNKDYTSSIRYSTLSIDFGFGTKAYFYSGVSNAKLDNNQQAILDLQIAGEGGESIAYYQLAYVHNRIGSKSNLVKDYEKTIEQIDLFLLNSDREWESVWLYQLRGWANWRICQVREQEKFDFEGKSEVIRTALNDYQEFSNRGNSYYQNNPNNNPNLLSNIESTEGFIKALQNNSCSLTEKE